jgi:hypothetical protein
VNPAAVPSPSTARDHPVRRSGTWRFWFAALFWILGCRGVAAMDSGIHIRSAEVANSADAYVLDATFQIDLGPTLEEALTRGVTLHFVTEFELLYERWYFLNLWNKTISTVEQRYRLNYNALTRHYRLSTGALTLSLETLREALALMGRVRGQQIATRDQLDPSLVYTAQIRLRIDTSQLPKPFQISSIGSKTWNLSSDWYRWTVKP